MDTHITTAPDIDERIGAPLGSPIRLPGGRGTLPHLEDHDLGLSSEATTEAETGGSATPGPREKLVPTTPARSRRTGLLSTVAVVIVLAGIGSLAWAERQGALQLPLPPQVVALLRTGLPVSSQVAGEVGVKPARVPTSPPANAQHNPGQSVQAARQQAEFAALKSGDAVPEVGVSANDRPTTPPISTLAPPAVQAASAPAVPASSPAAVTLPLAAAETGASANPVPAPAAPPVTPPIPVTAASLTPAITMPNMAVPAVATAPAAASTPPLVPVPAPKPLDPVQTASELQAAPFSTKQQVDMVGLVRELGAQLKESRLTVSQMQATVADLKEQLDTRMTEFDGRLGLAEAGTVLAQSAKAALPQPVMTAAAVPARPSIASRQSAPVAQAAPPVSTTSPASRSVKDFRVQGASPGLAVLNVLVAGPGEAPVLYVALGDQVPGVGRIKSIYQRGTTWLVQTDAGLIQ